MKPGIFFLFILCIFSTAPLVGQQRRRVFFSTQPTLTRVQPLIVNVLNKPDVDLRPVISQNNIYIRNQGSRGTCSVHALTFLLEYQYNTCLGVNQPDLSEEYMNFVSNKVTMNSSDGGFYSDLDKGYQQWGIVPESAAPYQSAQVSNIAQNVLNEGNLWSRFKADFIKPWSNTMGASAAQLERTLQYLDQGIPVAFGGWWAKPNSRTTTTILGVELMDVPSTSQKDFKDGKNPSGIMEDGHSVDLVGYKKSSSFPGGGYFIFRNSWGTGFGDNGYGYMPFSYVTSFANDLMAYVFSPLNGSCVGVQAVTAGKSKLDVLITDNNKEVKAGNWTSSLNNSRWNAWTSVLNGKARPGTPVAVVSRDDNKLDAFMAGESGQIFTAARDKNASNAHWRGWWLVLTGKTTAGGQVAAVARAPQKLDIFIIGLDGGVYTAAWDNNVASGQWRGWWRIGNLKARPGAAIAAVARDANKLDVFAIGTDGKLYTAAWDAAVDQGKWRGWWPVNDNAIAPNSPLVALARSSSRLDVFVVGQNKGVYTAAWDAAVDNGKWRGYWRIGNLGLNGTFPSLTAVCRAPSKLDVFAIGADGFTYTAAWDAAVDSGKWRGWWKIRNGKALNRGIAAAARDANKLDVFVVGLDQKVWTAAWDAAVADGSWRGWWKVDP